jgi:uncharacterized protein (DUF427 family)
MNSWIPFMNNLPDDLPISVKAARDQWRWRGQDRPPGAVIPTPDQFSVWDFPRPPRIVPETRTVVVRWGDLLVVHTDRAVCVVETAHPPSFYLPWEDVVQGFLKPAPGTSFCEWKGPAQYWDLVDRGRRLERVAWSYPSPLPGAEALKDRVAFYARHLTCTVDGEPVQPQPGAFYGGWITPELTGPFKGGPGTEGW